MQRRHALHTLMVGASTIFAASLLAACKPEAVSFDGVDITGAQYGQDFPLLDAQGQPRSVKEFAGKVVVVFFGYTQCPDVCPTTLQELVEAKALLGEQGHLLQGVFVSLDPERDTPEVLRAYAAAFDPEMVALTGNLAQITSVAKDFKVFFKKVDGRQPGSYTLDHSAGLYMYDPQGNLRVYQRYGQGPQALAKDAKALLDSAQNV
jgi:protein SCO1/2